MLSKRLDIIEPSRTIGISSKVKEMKSQGIEVLNLSVGEPDFNVPEKAKQCGIESLNNDITKYDLVPGMTILREEISKKLLEENNCNYAPDEIVVTSGAKTALTNALIAITDPGDEVLLVKPYWVSYSEMAKIVNTTPVVIETDKTNNFKLTPELLEKYISDKTKVLLLNNPSNPTGAIYSKDELLAICDVCLKHNIYIVSDEIYERICFDKEFISIASLSDEIRQITLTINGFAKSAALTGTRLGYVAAPKEIIKAITSIQGHLISHPCLAAQFIGYGALKYCKEDIDNMVKTYKNRRDLVTSRLNKIENLSYIYPEGAFYVFIDISRLKNKFEHGESLSSDFCDKLLEECKVAIVPGIAFGVDEYVRISFACSEETFTEALDRLDTFVQSIMN